MFPPPPKPYDPNSNPWFPGAPAENNPFYQVKPNDNNLMDIANKNGLDLNSLVNLNGNMKSLPPVGTYIVTQPQGLPGGTPASQNAFNLRNQRSPQQEISSYIPEIGRTKAQKNFLWGNLDLPTVQNAIATAVSTNGNVSIPIPNEFLTQLGATPQSMQANGFTYNTGTGLWMPQNAQPAVATNTTVPGAGSNPNNADFLNTKYVQDLLAQGKDPYYGGTRWDPNAHRGKGGYVRIVDLIRSGRLDEKTGKLRTPRQERRKKQGGQRPTSRATSETVLNLHLGSG
jgi:hypothetical protein